MTWLDWFVRSRADWVRAEFGTRRWVLPRNADGSENIVGALGDLMELTLAEFSADREGFERREGGVQAANMTAFFAGCLLPFLSGFIPVDRRDEELAGGPGYGLVLTRETAEMLVDAHPPERDYWRERLFDAQPVGAGLGGVYIEVPHGAVLTGKNYQLRAMFANPWRTLADPNDEDSPIIRTDLTLVTSVITARGSERPEGLVFATLDGQNNVGVVATPDTDILGYLDPLTYEDAEWQRTVTAHEVFNIFYERLTGFFRLVLAYAEHAPAETRGEMRLTPIDVFARNRNRPRKSETIFAMRRLSAPSDRLGRPPTPSAQPGWQLTARQHVAGHFKLQPHGPGHSLRRLIWVSGYARGPEDAPARPHALSV